ncbi:MAG: Na/Pi cotransporter family protein [Clostridia bacterium]|nr:Na/Pi cotransporter family protein [Clostridia bacterium]
MLHHFAPLLESEIPTFDVYNILALLCGLALFLFGMDIMGDSLKKSAGSSLKAILAKMTTNPISGFFLGLGVTAVIQSSSATTVMVVGFVNSGTMTLLQAAGVIIGANVGTAVTAWITALNGIGRMDGGTAELLQILKPDSWMPILAVIGICLVMFTKRGKKKDIGMILLGFAVLMTGMSMMSDSVAPLADERLGFSSILTMFENPILGVLAGLILTAVVQSSSASVGILQSLTVTGAITYGAAIPIVMGQNIGTCVTAVLSSIGANKNGKRAAVLHLLFNVIGVIIVLPLYYLVTWLIELGSSFVLNSVIIDMWGIALVHTLFKLILVAILFPAYKLLVKLSMLIVKDKEGEADTVKMLDERLLETPSIAVDSASKATLEMASLSISSLRDSLGLFKAYDAKLADSIRDIEGKVDVYEDTIGSYLVKVSACDLSERDSAEVTKLLHIIGDLERISDHAVNIVESAEEMNDKKLSFSEEAQRELATMCAAIDEILVLAEAALVNGDVGHAVDIEPLEQVVDDLRDRIKQNHIIRLQKSACTIEHGFILSDILTNLERVSDHCSNIGGCVIEIASGQALDLHHYIEALKQGNAAYDEKYAYFKDKYAIAPSEVK